MSEPRVPPLKPEELDEGQRAFLHPLTNRKGQYPNLFGVLCRNLALMEAWRDFGLYLMQGSRVDPALREILILRTAYRRDCDYEWHHHSRIASSLGLTAEQIEQVRQGGDNTDPRTALMIEVADELIDAGRLSDATWAEMTQRYGVEYTLDAVFTVGAYTALAMGLNSADVRPEGAAA